MTFPLRCAIIFIRLVSFRVVCFEEKLHKSSSHQEKFTGPSLNFLPKCGCTNYSAMPRSWTTLSFNVNTSHPSIPHAQRNKHHLHIKGAVTSVNQSKLLNSSAIKCTWSKKIWLCSVSFKRTIKKNHVEMRGEGNNVVFMQAALCRSFTTSWGQVTWTAKWPPFELVCFGCFWHLELLCWVLQFCHSKYKAILEKQLYIQDINYIHF